MEGLEIVKILYFKDKPENSNDSLWTEKRIYHYRLKLIKLDKKFKKKYNNGLDIFIKYSYMKLLEYIEQIKILLQDQINNLPNYYSNLFDHTITILRNNKIEFIEIGECSINFCRCEENSINGIQLNYMHEDGYFYVLIAEPLDFGFKSQIISLYKEEAIILRKKYKEFEEDILLREEFDYLEDDQ